MLTHPPELPFLALTNGQMDTLQASSPPTLPAHACPFLLQLVVTNTVAHNDRAMEDWSSKISLVSVAPLLAEAILRVEEGGTLQDLRVYDRDNVKERYLGQGHE